MQKAADIKVPITPKNFLAQINLCIILSKMLQKFLFWVKTSIFYEPSKSAKITLVKNITGPQNQSKGSRWSTSCDVIPGDR